MTGRRVRRRRYDLAQGRVFHEEGAASDDIRAGRAVLDPLLDVLRGDVAAQQRQVLHHEGGVMIVALTRIIHYFSLIWII